MPDEQAKRGGFPDSYCGRIYGEGGTELVSMGLQLLCEDPARLMADPDYFAFTLGVIKAAREGGLPWQ
jgi:hypothetical protein